jgi:hypothetical protein
MQRLGTKIGGMENVTVKEREAGHRIGFKRSRVILLTHGLYATPQDKEGAGL